MQPNPFVPPPPPGSGLAPRTRDMDGCLVAYRPTRFEANMPGLTADAKLSDRVTADVYILTTPGNRAIQIGGSEGGGGNAPRPHSHTVVAPAKFDGVWINSQEIVRACAPGGQIVTSGLVLGRIERGTQGNRPWRLISVQGTPEEGQAIAVWTAIMAGQATWNEPTPLPGFAPPPPGQTVAYTPPVPQPQPVAPAAPVYPQAYQPQAANDPQAQFQAWLAAQQAAAAPPPMQPPAPPAVGPAPAGWNQAAWEGLQQVQRDQVLAMMAGQLGAPQPGQPSGI